MFSFITLHQFVELGVNVIDKFSQNWNMNMHDMHFFIPCIVVSVFGFCNVDR